MDQIVMLKPGAAAITIDQQLQITLSKLSAEEIAPGPLDVNPGGSVVNAHLQCSDGYGHQQEIELSELSPPYESKRVAFFQGYRLRWVNYHNAGGMRLELGIKKLERGDYQELGTFTLQRKTPLKIDAQLRVTFNAHSHKRTRVGGSASPLMLNVDYDLSERESEHGVPDRLQPDEGRRQWYWREYRFNLLEHRYNEWMKVEIWRAQEE